MSHFRWLIVLFTKLTDNNQILVVHIKGAYNIMVMIWWHRALSFIFNSLWNITYIFTSRDVFTIFRPISVARSRHQFVGSHPNRRITRFSVNFSMLRFSIISIVDIPLNIL